jgi:hypothetical protein
MNSNLKYLTFSHLNYLTKSRVRKNNEYTIFLPAYPCIFVKPVKEEQQIVLAGLS